MHLYVKHANIIPRPSTKDNITHILAYIQNRVGQLEITAGLHKTKYTRRQ